ncbi:thermonuclease family protein [Castellaniella sp.]|uniref:thermonuclease family protein n=1 Tax=Castellaniella sp. TaxID=1955812 RepID=UPI002AFE007C|nr:thermonuclease family protein [Castellaniella sp.]
MPIFRCSFPRRVRSGRAVPQGVSARSAAPALLAAALFLALPAPAAHAAGPYALSGRIVAVSDGDTLTLLAGRDRHRVRLASIDAPETGHGRQRPGQPFAQAARKALADLVAGKTLTLHCFEQDRYGRDVCDVPLPDGRTANRVMVETGLAWANRQGGGKYLRDEAIAGLERRARDRRLGLWSQAGAVAPWDWRWQCWDALENGRSASIC